MLGNKISLKPIFLEQSFQYVFPGNFNPRRLFQRGQNGAIWAPFDPTSVFTTNDGSTLAAAGNAVGRIEDVRDHELGPELVANTTPNLRVLRDGVNPIVNYSTGDILTTGKWYRVTFTTTGNVGNQAANLFLGSTTLSNGQVAAGFNGTKTLYAQHTAGVLRFLLVPASATVDFVVSEFSVKELFGNQLAQSNASLRGTLQSITGNSVIRMDLTSDTYPTLLPNGITGQILVAGVGGQRVRDVTVASGGTFSLGPTTWTGGSAGDLSAVHGPAATGGIVGAVLRQGVFTDREVDELVRFMKARGAGAPL